MLVNNCWHRSEINFLLLLVLEITHKWKLHHEKKRSLKQYCSILAIKKIVSSVICLSECLSLGISRNIDINLKALLVKFRDRGYLDQIKWNME